MSATVAAVAVSFPPRYDVCGIAISGATYATATESIIAAAQARQSALVAATSVHGLTHGVLDPAFGRHLNNFDMLTPDGQPVRWALNALYGLGLAERVYGPTLMLRICAAAAAADLSVYFYGSLPHVLERLATRLQRRTPGLRIAGYR